jgi:hypothetical protein
VAGVWGGEWGPGWGGGWGPPGELGGARPGEALVGDGPPLGLGLGRTAVRCRARILRRGMRRSTSGPRPMGSTLDFGQSPLVTEKLGR